MAKEGRSMRRVSMDLQIDRASLHRSLREGSNPEWKTIEKVLGYLGYHIELVRAKRGTKWQGRTRCRSRKTLGKKEAIV